MKGGDRILVFGYGNPGRGDDGLGPLLATAVQGLGRPDTDVESDYQLGFDDAAALPGHSVVIFVDADLYGRAPFHFSRVEPQLRLGCSGHRASPAEVLGLAHELYGRRPDAYLLGVRGYDFGEFRESLSARARVNLGEALAFLSWALQERRFDDYVLMHGQGPEAQPGVDAGGAP